MPLQFQFRRGTSAQNNAFTGAIGEISVDTDNKTLRVHDGATPGGISLATVTQSQTLVNKTLTSPTITGGTLTGATIATPTITGATISLGANLALNGRDITGTGNINITGSITASGNITTSGNLIIGDQVTDTVSIVADVNSNITPLTTSSFTLGTPTNVWANVYATTFTGNTVGAHTGTVSGNVTGNLTGNVTGNVSGSAGTVSGAAQTAITSLGTLTSLTVSGPAVISTTPTAATHAANKQYVDRTAIAFAAAMA